MKKVMILLSACLALLLTSCGEKKASPQYAKKASAVALYKGTPLYSPNDEGKMVYATEAALADVIDLCLDKSNNIIQKQAIRKLKDGTEEEFQFVLVSYKDKEYWTRKIFVSAPNTVPAVFLDTAKVYSSPALVDIVAKAQFNKNEFVAVDTTTLRDEFVKVYIYSSSSDYGKERYVKESNVLKTDKAVVMVKTLNKLTGKDVDSEIADEIVTIMVKDWNISIDDDPLNVYFVNEMINNNIKYHVSDKCIANISTMYWNIYK